MKVLFISSEVAPFAKTGGLADVSGALPAALSEAGMDVRVVMPGYGVNRYGDEAPVRVLTGIDVTVGSKSYPAEVTESKLPGTSTPIYFISNAEFFDRPELYQRNGKDYPDNAERFVFFCKAAVWMMKGLGWIPDIVHCNDWQTAMLPVMLKNDLGMKNDPELQKIHSVFTIHNMAYQGVFPTSVAFSIGLPMELFHPGGLEYYGSMNFLKGGLIFSDKLTTVSPTYAREIQSTEFGCGLDGVLRDRSADLSGILNGIDYSQWNPATDEHLPANYDIDNLAGKAKCKAALQKELGLKVSAKQPLLVMISRLDPQKGLDLLMPIIPDILKKGAQLAVLGAGLPEYHSELERLAKENPGQMAATLKFDNGLAHRMEAGGDAFVMPSRFEPCGLNQLYSLKYGTLPIVRRTGGLADSVEDISADGKSGTGFVFDICRKPQVLQTINRALDLYSDSIAWQQAQRRGMETDFSWKSSAGEYGEIYKRLIG